MGRLTRPVMEAGRGLTGQRGEGQQAGGRGQAGLGARREPQPRPREELAHSNGEGWAPYQQSRR